MLFFYLIKQPDDRIYVCLRRSSRNKREFEQYLQRVGVDNTQHRWLSIPALCVRKTLPAWYDYVKKELALRDGYAAEWPLPWQKDKE